MYNFNIEDWFKHSGCYDREQISGIPLMKTHEREYLQATDDWWENLSDKEKETAYNEFFNDSL